MTNKQLLEITEKRLHHVKLLGAKPPVRLVRYRNTLEKLVTWEKRLRIAANKMKSYNKLKKYYERWIITEKL